MFMSSMVIAGKMRILAKLPKMQQLNQHNSSLFAIRSFKKQNYFFKIKRVLKKPPQKFCLDLFSRREELDKFCGNFSCEFAKILRNVWKSVQAKIYFAKINLSNLNKLTLYKKWSFPLRISSVNLTKSAGNCGFGHIYWKNPERKTFFCAVWS